MAQAVDQPVVHDEVHAAVAPHLLRLPGDFGRYGVLVAPHERLARRIGQERMFAQVLKVGNPRPGELRRTEGVPLDGILARIALAPRDGVHAAVGTRRVDVVLEVDDTAALGPDERQRVVAVGERVGTRLFAGQFEAVDRGGVHRHQVAHAVAAVDVEELADGPQSVGGVDVAAVGAVEFEAPVALVVVPEGFEVVDVGPLGLEQLAEEPVLRHVERRELEEVIDAVLEHHAVALPLLGRVDQLPALLERRGGRHLDGHMLALLHGVDRHRDGEPPLRKNPLRGGHPLGVEVAQGDNPHAVQMGEALDGPRTAHAQTDEPHPHHGDGLHRQTEHRLLARLAGRRVEDEHPLLDTVPFVRRRATAQGKQRAEHQPHPCEVLHRQEFLVVVMIQK